MIRPQRFRPITFYVACFGLESTGSWVKGLLLEQVTYILIQPLLRSVEEITPIMRVVGSAKVEDGVRVYRLQVYLVLLLFRLLVLLLLLLLQEKK